MKKQLFKEYPLSEEILQALQILGYEEPTKIQSLVVPTMFGEEDVIVQAQTGSGKTAAFGIPICEKAEWLLNQPQTLILVPTRELAIQVAEEVQQIGRLKRLKVLALFGRVSIEKQELSLKQKTHIVVGTPGRVFDLMERGSLVLDQLKQVIIDEADEMFFIGLREQVERILKELPEHRRTYLFSATGKEEVLALAHEYMNHPVVIKTEEETLTVEQIHQLAYKVTEEEKLESLCSLMIRENPDSAMIFVNTKDQADYLSKRLLKSNIPSYVLHGGMVQKERMKVMEGFKRGYFRYLVTTDVAARGIDIDQVSLVLNYDMPRGKENYVHRIGRTGRKGNDGRAITFCTEKEIMTLTEIMEYTRKSFPIIEQGIPKPNQEEIDLFQKKIHTSIEPKLQKKERFQAAVTVLQINAGKKGKLRPVDVVGSICSIEAIKPEDIGVIEIGNLMTTVEILHGKGEIVLKELRNKTIKGKIRRIKRV